MLLLDEPLGALDLKLRKQMQIELKRIQTEVNITFIHVTHDQEEAMTMADRIAVMNQGQIEQIGPPVELYEQPRTAFVAGFLGVSNLISATVEGPGRVRLAGGGRGAGARRALRDAPGDVRIGVRPEKVRRAAGASETSDGADNRSTAPSRTSATSASAPSTSSTRRPARSWSRSCRTSAVATRHLATGQPVQVLWDPENTFVITDAGSVPTLEELV